MINSCWLSLARKIKDNIYSSTQRINLVDILRSAPPKNKKQKRVMGSKQYSRQTAY